MRGKAGRMMRALRVLITNRTLASRTGTETYVRDLALGLLERGHTPIVYTTDSGDIAREIQAATVSVVEDLGALAEAPDVIHGHHNLETMTALLRFPGVPGLFFCHDWSAWHDWPPCFPRIRRYVAVDDTCRDRLVLRHGISAESVRVLFNAVDLRRFQPRGPLPDRPEKALVFSNAAREETHLHTVREACALTGLDLDVVGSGVGNSCKRPEEILRDYDLVFAKARCALEAMAVGAAVILCDMRGVGGMVTTENWDRLRPLNFGGRTLQGFLRPDVIVHEIQRYNPRDAALVSQRTRAEAGRDDALNQLIAWYKEMIDEQSEGEPARLEEEERNAATFLRWLTPIFREGYDRETALHETERYLHHVVRTLQADNDCLREQTASLSNSLATLNNSAAMRLRNRLVRLPMIRLLAQMALNRRPA
jgi:hypothetical protein